MKSLLIALSVVATAPVAKPAEPAKTTEGAKPEAKAESGECHHDPAAAAAAPAQGALTTRGDKLKGLPVVQLTELLKSPGAYDGKTIGLEGTVRKACQRKGCWMELATSEKGQGVRVTFKDYGFFVPLDSAGSTAHLEGTVKLAELAPERAEHYASEGAQVSKDKDGKYHEVQIVALGVELKK